MLPSYDSEIRKAFHHKKLSSKHLNSDVIVVDELGLDHGSNRIDIAVLNGSIHGYEIKSSQDTLKRLDGQLSTYKQALQKITFISAPNHVQQLEAQVPVWCGIILADKGKNGAINFSTIRQAKKNPEVNPVMLAHLLWKNEAQDLLKDLGIVLKGNSTRLELYQVLVKHVTIKQLSTLIRAKLTARCNWRSVAQPVLNDD